MLIPCKKLHEWAATVEPGARPYVQQFITEAEAKMAAEVEAAKKCLWEYGYKVYEDQHHEYHDMKP